MPSIVLESRNLNSFYKERKIGISELKDFLSSLKSLFELDLTLSLMDLIKQFSTIVIPEAMRAFKYLKEIDNPELEVYCYSIPLAMPRCSLLGIISNSIERFSKTMKQAKSIRDPVKSILLHHLLFIISNNLDDIHVDSEVCHQYHLEIFKEMHLMWVRLDYCNLLFRGTEQRLQDRLLLKEFVYAPLKSLKSMTNAILEELVASSDPLSQNLTTRALIDYDFDEDHLDAFIEKINSYNSNTDSHELLEYLIEKKMQRIVDFPSFWTLISENMIRFPVKNSLVLCAPIMTRALNDHPLLVDSIMDFIYKILTLEGIEDYDLVRNDPPGAIVYNILASTAENCKDLINLRNLAILLKMFNKEVAMELSLKILSHIYCKIMNQNQLLQLLMLFEPLFLAELDSTSLGSNFKSNILYRLHINDIERNESLNSSPSHESYYQIIWEQVKIYPNHIPLIIVLMIEHMIENDSVCISLINNEFLKNGFLESNLSCRISSLSALIKWSSTQANEPLLYEYLVELLSVDYENRQSYFDIISCFDENVIKTLRLADLNALQNKLTQKIIKNILKINDKSYLLLTVINKIGNGNEQMEMEILFLIERYIKDGSIINDKEELEFIFMETLLNCLKFNPNNQILVKMAFNQLSRLNEISATNPNITSSNFTLDHSSSRLDELINVWNNLKIPQNLLSITREENDKQDKNSTTINNDPIDDPQLLDVYQNQWQ